MTTGDNNVKVVDKRNHPVFIHSELDDLGLTPEAFRVYCHLARRAGSNGDAYPKQQSIGDVCFPRVQRRDSDRNRADKPISASSARYMAMKAIEALKEHGLIEVEYRRKEDGRKSSCIYTLTDKSSWKSWEEINLGAQGDLYQSAQGDLYQSAQGDLYQSAQGDLYQSAQGDQHKGIPLLEGNPQEEGTPPRKRKKRGKTEEDLPEPKPDRLEKSSTTGKPIDDPEPEQSNVAGSGISPPSSAAPPPPPVAVAEKSVSVSARLIEVYNRLHAPSWADADLTPQRDYDVMKALRDSQTPERLFERFEAALWFVSQDKWWSAQVKTFDDVLRNLVKWSESADALRKQKQPDRPDEEKAERLRKLREQAEINHAYSLFVERAKGAWMRKFYPPSPDDPDRARKGIFAWSKLSDWEKEDIYRQYRAYEHANHPRNPKNVNANSSSVAS